MSLRTLFMFLAGSHPLLSFRMGMVVTWSIMLPCSLGRITFTSGG